MKQPLVSIVMVNYNHEDFIGESIESVIAQTYENWELIIVDDGSTDSSPEIIRKYAAREPRIRPCLQDRNRHICAATNIGIANLTGEFVARLDSDDVWCARKLEKQMQYMREHPEGALCFTKLDIIDGNGKIVNESQDVLYQIYNGREDGKKGWIRHFFFYGNTLIQSTLLMKREVLDETGGFNLAYMQGHDFDFFVRAILKYDFIFLEEPLVKYRRTEVQNSAWNDDNNRRFFNEHMNIRYHFFDNMPDEMFKEIFRDDFVNHDSSTHEELLCEQAFLLCRCIHEKESNPVLGLKKLEELMQNPDIADLLEKKFHYTPKDYYQQSVRPLFVTDAILGELENLRKLCPMLNDQIVALRSANQDISGQLLRQQEEITKLRETINRMEQSKSWKITKPLRNIKKTLDKC